MGLQVGGAATSGQGLTALQVALALLTTANAQVPRRGVEETSADGEEGVAQHPPGTARRTKSQIAEESSRLTEEACAATRDLVVSRDLVPDSEEEIKVTEYAPRVFQFLRHADAVTDEHFADEWTLPKERLKMELGEGRSQALFLKSKTMEFMVKTIAKEEVDVLLRVLQGFAHHVAKNPDSVLMRFYLLLRVTVGKEVGYILCFNDVFGGASVLHEKWDIKGRIPKPGKFQYYPHLVRRAYEPDPYLIETPRNRDVVIRESGHDNAEPLLQGAEDGEKLSTYHDKDLTRLFWLDEDTNKALVGQLLRDFKFLREAGLMDYSLLIGVTYNENKTSRRGKKYAIENMRMTAPPGPPRAQASEQRPRAQSGTFNEDGEELRGLSQFSHGVHSLYDQETYFIGIIDMLTFYSFKKKTANFFKSFLWKQSTLSTIPPGPYEKRIASFTRLIFPEVAKDAEKSKEPG